MTNRLLFTVLFTIGTLGICAGDERMVPGTTGEITRMLKDVFGSNDAPFAAMRHPIAGRESRLAMLKFIENQVELLQLLAKQKGYESTLETVHFNTTLNYMGSLKEIDGADVIFVLKGNVSRSEDEPLMILTNYDTGVDSNEVNEGSGVAALLVLIEILINEMASNQYKVTNSVIFAFTDVAYKKYSGNHASEGVTGGAYIANNWLPRFLSVRKSFRGAVVLDSIMNYNDEDQSQLVANLGLDKSFPAAYTMISEGSFKGDFLGLLHRDDRLDNPLVLKFQESWEKTLVEPRGNKQQGNSGALFLDPRLLKFTFETDIYVSPSVNDFLNSEQSAFWNHHVEAGGSKHYPAITLTDTRQHRDGVCRIHCAVAQMTTKKNLAFMKRTVQSLHALILDMQTSKNGAMSTVQASLLLLLAPMLVYIKNSFYNVV